MARTNLENVTKVFTENDGSEIVAVDGVSLDVDDGEFLVLVGPSGCGKSTTLRMIAGLETVTDGTVRIGDDVVNGVPAKDRDIAMVFQSYALYPHMTVRENMSFGLEESTDLPDSEIEKRVERTAEMMEIPELLDRKPGELSGGQQQRVALGRAIVREPSTFLMDEPLSNLDAKLRAQMRTELKRLQEDLGTTTIYVTHDQTEAMTMGDRIAILEDGRLQQVGTPLECYHRPANLFVADFVGDPSMNFLDVAVSRTEGRTILVGDDLWYPISEDVAAEVATHSDLVLGVRPEDVDVVDGEPTSEHELAATVDVVEPMGDENVVYLELGETEVDESNAETVVATVGGMRRIESGQSVSASVPEDAIHLFEAETGEALRNRRLETAGSNAPRI